jgi:hypothetical protein
VNHRPLDARGDATPRGPRLFGRRRRRSLLRATSPPAGSTTHSRPCTGLRDCASGGLGARRLGHRSRQRHRCSAHLCEEARGRPREWRLARVLLDGLTAFDATLHIEDGFLWLFANIVEGPEDRGELWLLSSRSLDGEWRPHPQNPIVIDPGTARPAGRLFRRGDLLIRPGQDCSIGYGEALVLNRVDVLSPGEYRETPVDRIEPDWMSGVERTHTYTFDSRCECQ